MKTTKRQAPLFFLTRRAFGARPWHHVDAYRAAPGWYFVELGGWTLEVCP